MFSLNLCLWLSFIGNRTQHKGSFASDLLRSVLQRSIRNREEWHNAKEGTRQKFDSRGSLAQCGPMRALEHKLHHRGGLTPKGTGWSIQHLHWSVIGYWLPLGQRAGLGDL